MLLCLMLEPGEGDAEKLFYQNAMRLFRLDENRIIIPHREQNTRGAFFSKPS